jgi:hypothetical protein
MLYFSFIYCSLAYFVAHSINNFMLFVAPFYKFSATRKIFSVLLFLMWERFYIFAKNQ